MRDTFLRFKEGFLKLIMRTLIFLCCTVMLGLSPKKSLSQDADIIINENSTMSVKQVLKLIHKQADYRFIYSNALIKEAPNVFLEKGTVKASKLLEKTLSPIGLTYDFTEDKTIQVKRRPGPIVSSQTASKEEVQYEVAGQVIDVNGQPLPGASVVEKGTTNGVSTDFDGNYSITVPDSNATLIFSSLGFKTIEVTTDGRTTVNVTMEEDAALLEEVVVIGYGTQERRKVTGAIENIDGEAIVGTPVLSVDNALAGRIPGLTVNQTNAEPGRDNARLFVRGVGTTGNKEPLIVIDGVANRGGFSRLDPNDIESISVLKDASAAIYGAQAANGVILVTTKRGKEGEATFNYTYNRAFVSPTRKINLADAALYARSVNTWASQQGQPDVYSQEQIQDFSSGRSPSTDWIDEVYKSNSSQVRHNLSVSGGTENIKYFASLGTADQEGLFKGNDDTGFKQYNIRANIDARVAKNLTLRLDLAGRKEIRSFLQYEDATIYSNTVRAAPDIPATINGFPARGREGFNPLAIARGPGYLRQTGYIFNGLVNLDYKIPFLKGLSLGGWMAVDVNSDLEKHFNQPFTYYEDANNDGEPEAVQGGPDFPNTFLSLVDANRESVTYNANINYNATFGDHTVGTFLAYEQNEIDTNTFFAQRRGFQSDQIDELFAGSSDATLQSNSGSASELTRQNYFGRASYDYKSKYLAQFIFRYDGSSIFPKGKRFGFFPGFEAAWRISQEGFFSDNVTFINELKLRGSYGELGNDRVDPFQFLNLFSLATENRTGYVFGGTDVNVLNQGVAANPNITWETVKTYNLGLDAGLFANTLTFTMDVFKQVRDNILGPRNVTVPNYTGLSLPDENIREVENKGIELQALFTKKIGNVNLYVGGNYSYIRNEAVFLDEEGIYPEEYQKGEGHSVLSSLAYDYLGFYRTEQDLETFPGLNGTANIGDPYYRDVNGDGLVNSDDRIRIDVNLEDQNLSNVPQVQYGFQLGGDYNGIELNAVFAGQAKALRYLRYSFSNGNNGYAYFLENAFDATANPDGTLPAYNRGNTELSTLWLRDVSFLRLKSLELAYSLPKEVISSIGLSNLRFSLSGYNLITWDKLKGDGLTDPESVNVEGWQYPHTRNINFGINATF